MHKIRRRIWLLGFSLVFAVVAISVLSVLERRMEKEEERRALLDVPEGWQILLYGENVMDMVEQGDVIWAGTRNGVYLIDRRKAEIIERMEFCREITYVTSILLDDEGTLWVSYENGLVTWDGEKHEYYNSDNALPDDRANFVTQDREGNIWVGTWGGAAYYDGDTWHTITTEDGLSVDMVNVIMEDSLGNFWFGAYNVRGGAVSIAKQDGTWQYFTMDNGIPNNNVTGFWELEEGTVWVGTGFYNRGGAARFVFEEGGYRLEKTLEKEDGLAGEKVRSLFHDNLGNLWFGSEFDGIAVIDETKMEQLNFTVLTEDDGLSHNEVLSIMQDVDGDMWLGTLDGITKLDYDAVQSVHKLKN